MTEVFIKKYWDEEDVLYYLHFVDGVAVEQIEITPTGKKFLTEKSEIYDQSLEELDLKPEDIIEAKEFFYVWNNR